MIVNHEAKQIEKTEDDQKEYLLAELRKESASVISLAAVYAKGFEATGIDVTRAWETAEQQMAIIQQNYQVGYQAGYIDGVAKGKEIERAETKEQQKDKYKRW